MSYKFSIPVMSILLFLMMPVSIAEAAKQPAYVATGAQPLVSPPTYPPWYEAALVTPMTLIPGGHIWVGADNDPREGEKVLLVTLSSTDDDVGDVNLVSAVGYDAKGNTCRGTPGGLGTDSSGAWFNASFEPQPDFEMVKIVNQGPNEVDITKIKTEWFCNEASEVQDYGCYLDSVTVGISEYPLAITQLLLGHESSPVNPFVPPVLELSVPGDTWSYEYVTTDPETGLPLPYDAWLWTCDAGDGIAAGEMFDMSMTLTDCMPEGKYLFYVYDELEGAWQKFAPTVENIEPLFPDLIGDCKIDFYDMAVLAAGWLRGT